MFFSKKNIDKGVIYDCFSNIHIAINRKLKPNTEISDYLHQTVSDEYAKIKKELGFK